MFNFLSHRQREVFINKFPRTLENPERGGRHQFVLHQKAVFKEPCKRTHTHLQENRAYTRSCMHQHTWLHNETPYFLWNLKKNLSPSSLSNISLAIHVCARASVTHTHVHMHGQSNIACFPPKQHASSAWKPRDGRRGTHLLQLDIFHGNCILM